MYQIVSDKECSKCKSFNKFEYITKEAIEHNIKSKTFIKCTNCNHTKIYSSLMISPNSDEVMTIYVEKIPKVELF
jgi:hypothetical protein